MKDSGRQKDRQRWERKEWASLVEKHPRRVKASPWGRSVKAVVFTQDFHECAPHREKEPSPSFKLGTVSPFAASTITAVVFKTVVRESDSYN